MLLVLAFACRQNDDTVPEEPENTSWHYYYDSDGEKRFLDSIITHEYLMIGFDSIHSKSDIINSLSSVWQIQVSEEEIYQPGLRAHRFILASVSNVTSLEQLDDLISTIEKIDIVDYAAHGYETYEHTSLFPRHIIYSYANEFIVEVTDTSDLSGLYQMMLETNTSIIEQTGFRKHTYILKADKNAQGNALQMGNLFQESGLFKCATANFHYFDIN